jgi:hypothetical protein
MVDRKYCRSSGYPATGAYLTGFMIMSFGSSLLPIMGLVVLVEVVQALMLLVYWLYQRFLASPTGQVNCYPASAQS